MKLPSRWSCRRELPVFTAALRYQALGLKRRGSETDNPVFIGVEKCSRAEPKGKVVPRLRGFLAVLRNKPADGSEQRIGIPRRHLLQIPGPVQPARMQMPRSKRGHYWNVR